MDRRNHLRVTEWIPTRVGIPIYDYGLNKPMTPRYGHVHEQYESEDSDIGCES